jgi:HTH-type transcriptional regulator/antitoxin HipB
MQSEVLGSLVSFHRKKAGLTQMQLAELAGVSRFIVQELEAGKGRTTWKHLESVLQALNLRFEPSGPLVDEWRQWKETSK